MGLQSIKFARVKRESNRGIALLGNIERMMCQADTGKLRDQTLQAEISAAVVKKLWPLRDKLEELKEEIRKMLEQHQKLKYWQTMTEAVKGEGEYIKTLEIKASQNKDNSKSKDKKGGRKQEKKTTDKGDDESSQSRVDGNERDN